MKQEGEYQNNIEKEKFGIKEWEGLWRDDYLKHQRARTREVLRKYGVEISENECDQYFEKVNIVNQEDFQRKIQEIENCSEEEAEVIVKREWGVLDINSDKIYVNPVKQDGRIMPVNDRLVPHEVLHLASSMLNANQETTRVGMFTDENSRKLGEIIINALDSKITEEQPGSMPPPPGHEFVNVLRKIAPFESWVKASFTIEGYDSLKQLIEEKLGKNGLKIINILCKYDLWYELNNFIGGEPLSLPRYISEEDRKALESIEGINFKK